MASEPLQGTLNIGISEIYMDGIGDFMKDPLHRHFLNMFYIGAFIKDFLHRYFVII